MASRADQLVALELWPAATEHRPLALASARADGTRSHAAADRQTHRLAKPVGRLEGRLFARPHSSVRHIDRESLVTAGHSTSARGRPTVLIRLYSPTRRRDRGVEALDDVRSNLIALEAPSEAITRARTPRSGRRDWPGFDRHGVAAVRRGLSPTAWFRPDGEWHRRRDSHVEVEIGIQIAALTLLGIIYPKALARNKPETDLLMPGQRRLPCLAVPPTRRPAIWGGPYSARDA